jgi:hypothetical protein
MQGNETGFISRCKSYTNAGEEAIINSECAAVVHRKMISIK